MGTRYTTIFDGLRRAADNGRFGTMAAVIPQTILWEFARYYPAGSSVEAATAPSRWDVRRHPDSVSAKLTEYQVEKGNFRKTKKGLNSIKK